MATFRLSQGVLTEEWTSTPGQGGVRGWACRGLCTDTLAAYYELTKNQLTRYEFREVPYRRELVVIALDGTSPVIWQHIDVRLGPIHAGNIAPSRWVYYCIKLGPVRFGNHAPMQDAGTYAGLSIMQYAVDFQPLKYT